MQTLTPSAIRPLNDRILVKPEIKDVTEGGIILPAMAQERPTIGEVLAVGPGKRNDDGIRSRIDVNPGDKILFTKFAGTEVKVDGRELILIAEKDVLGTIA